jgi:predicted GIY-YIG superfamily endonuclease
MTTLVEKSHFCYVLQQVNNTTARNYIGYTVNPTRRIRQHNGFLSGGARFTKNKIWEYLLIFSCPSWNSTRGLQMEWLIKHPLRKKKRSTLYKGSLGVIRSLHEIIKRVPLHEIITIYVHDDYYEQVNAMIFTNTILILKMNL